MEKPSIVLIPAVHDKALGTLIREEMAENLQALFGDEFNRKPAICMEGFNLGRTPILPGDLNYEFVNLQAWPTLYQKGFSPILYGADPRRTRSDELNARFATDIDLFFEFEEKYVEITEKPVSLEEAVQWVREGRKLFRIKTKPSRQIREIANRCYRLEKEWIKSYRDLALYCVKQHGKAYVIAGGAHVVCLHIATGWPMEWITGNVQDCTPLNIYTFSVNFNLIADAIRRM